MCAIAPLALEAQSKHREIAKLQEDLSQERKTCLNYCQKIKQLESKLQELGGSLKPNNF
jgi:hypothetical protein